MAREKAFRHISGRPLPPPAPFPSSNVSTKIDPWPPPTGAPPPWPSPTLSPPPSAGSPSSPCPAPNSPPCAPRTGSPRRRPVPGRVRARDTGVHDGHRRPRRRPRPLRRRPLGHRLRHRLRPAPAPPHRHRPRHEIGHRRHRVPPAPGTAAPLHDPGDRRRPHPQRRPPHLADRPARRHRPQLREPPRPRRRHPRYRRLPGGPRLPHHPRHLPHRARHRPPRAGPCPRRLLRLLTPPRAPTPRGRPADGTGRGHGLVQFVRAAHEGQRNTRLFWAGCRAYENGTRRLPRGRARRSGRPHGLTDREARAHPRLRPPASPRRPEPAHTATAPRASAHRASAHATRAGHAKGARRLRTPLRTYCGGCGI